jgi:hypothetical protein
VSYQPRIRTLKPENWQDEAVGTLSRDARLLRDVLITFADDDGRWRHLPSAIIGHGYPYDDDLAPAKLKKWTGELVAAGLVVLYDHDSATYGCFPTWHLHQQINKYRPSKLPECPDSRVISRDDARIRKGTLRESSGSPTGDVRESSHPHAQARGSGSGSVPVPAVDVVEDARAQIDDTKVQETVAILRTCPRLTFDLELMGVANALLAYPAVDHRQAAHTTVSNASDPNYRTTDAGRALRYALEDLDRRQGQVQDIRAAHSKRREHPADAADADLADLAASLRAGSQA